jgi:hypothetical protein
MDTTNKAPKIPATDPDAASGKKSRGARPLKVLRRPTQTLADILSDTDMTAPPRVSYRWAAANAARLARRFAFVAADGIAVVSASGITVNTRGATASQDKEGRDVIRSGARSIDHDSLLMGEELEAALTYLAPMADYVPSAGGSVEVDIDLDDLE